MSILAIDFGSIHTRAVLLDRIDGVYQLVARAETRTTNGFPVQDLSVGFDRALRDISAATGRTFTGPAGLLITPENVDRAGVDLFVATASVSRPLRTIIVGLMREYSAESARRAASGTYADIVASIHLDDGRTTEERLNAIIDAQPDVIVVAGGVDGGSKAALSETLALIRMAVSVIDKARRPVVVYAGNGSVIEDVQAAFKDLCEVLIARNVRPTIEDEQLANARAQLVRAFDRHQERQGKAFASIASMAASGVIPTAQGYSTVVQYLGQRSRQNVLALDVGSASSTAALWVDGALHTAIRTDIGLGHSAPRLLDVVGVEALRRWLPFYIRRVDLMNYVANKSLRPMTVPAELRETYIEHALLRTGGRALIASTGVTTRDFPTIIAAGAGLTATGDPSYTAMLALDIAQPVGVSRLLSDPFALIPALGAAAVAKPEAVVQALDGSNLEMLGTAFSLAGKPALDRPAMQVSIRLSDGRTVKHAVDGGHIWQYALPLGETADVRVQAGRSGSFGKVRRLHVKAEGGLAGLIFDARGRPLEPASTPEARAKQMPQWILEATDAPMIDIPARWLKPELGVDKDDAPAGELSGARKARGRRGKRGKVQQEETDDALKELRDATLS